MNYALEDLLRVRLYREDRAQIYAKKKAREYEAADRAFEEKKKELSDYKQYRPERERELFENMKNQQVSMKDLEDFKLMIALLRDRQTALEQEVQSAEQDKNDAWQQMEDARKARQRATREKEKIEEHKRLWLEEYQRVKEKEQEKEAEEFRAKLLSLVEEEDGTDENQQPDDVFTKQTDGNITRSEPGKWGC